MTTDTLTETVSQLAARVNVTTATVARWIHAGVAVAGARVKLAARRIGGRWSIPRAAWEAFEAGCNPGAAPVPESPARVAARGKRAQEALRKQLG